MSIPKIFLRVRPAEYIVVLTSAWICIAEYLISKNLDVAGILQLLVRDLFTWGILFVFFFSLYVGLELMFRAGSRSLKSYWSKLIAATTGFRDLMPLLFLSFAFIKVGGGNTLVNRIGLFDTTSILLWADKALFSCQPSQCLTHLSHPLLTEYFSFIYIIYPWFILLTAFWLQWRKGSSICQDFILSIVLASSVAYLFFVLMPAVSPEYVLEYSSNLNGGYFKHQLDAAFVWSRSSENDCCLFPSLHVGLSTIVWLHARKANRRLELPFAITAVSEWLAPVYLRRHFAIDSLGGLTLAVFCFKASQRLNEKWRQKKG